MCSLVIFLVLLLTGDGRLVHADVDGQILQEIIESMKETPQANFDWSAVTGGMSQVKRRRDLDVTRRRRGAHLISRVRETGRNEPEFATTITGLNRGVWVRTMIGF